MHRNHVELTRRAATGVIAGLLGFIAVGASLGLAQPSQPMQPSQALQPSLPSQDWSAMIEDSVRSQLNSQPNPLTDARRAGAQEQTSQAPQSALHGKLKVEVKIGAPDPRLSLAPCQRIEPFLPNGVRLWGKTLMGVRCLAGASWSITVPVHVMVFGPGLVASANMTAGAVPAEQDFRVMEVELSKDPGTPLLDVTQLKGRVLARNLTAGQVLHAEYLRRLPTVNQGDPVQVKVIGTGFTLIYDGIAMNAAAEGQVIRVRGENGKVLSGPLTGTSLQIRL